MPTRIALVGDIHGNVAALEAAMAEIDAANTDWLAITGDLVLNGPRPAESIARVRELEAGGAVVVQGNTDVAVADFDYGAAFPWMEDVPDTHRAAAEWAQEQLSDDDLEWLRRLPWERRITLDTDSDDSDTTMVLICHGSPGSQTQGLTTDLDPGETLRLLARTDARVVGCGHTHVAEVREVGRKLIVNPGSCGYAFDGDPNAAWALLTIDDDGEPSAELHRAAYDATSVANELSERGLAGDVYRAATVRRGILVR